MLVLPTQEVTARVASAEISDSVGKLDGSEGIVIDGNPL
jgi:hypothetical protein